MLSTKSFIAQYLLWVPLTADLKEYIQNSIPDFQKVTYKITQNWHLSKGKETSGKLSGYWIGKHWALDNKETQNEKKPFQFTQLASLCIAFLSKGRNLSKTAPLPFSFFSKWQYVKQERNNAVILHLAPNYIPYKYDFKKLLFAN